MRKLAAEVRSCRSLETAAGQQEWRSSCPEQFVALVDACVGAGVVSAPTIDAYFVRALNASVENHADSIEEELWNTRKRATQLCGVKRMREEDVFKPLPVVTLRAAVADADLSRKLHGIQSRLDVSMLTADAADTVPCRSRGFTALLPLAELPKNRVVVPERRAPPLSSPAPSRPDLM